MSLRQSLYLHFIRGRFIRSFKPLEFKKGMHFFVSVPGKPKDFLESLSFLGALRKLGSIVFLMPKSFEEIREILNPELFQNSYYYSNLTVISKEFNFLKRQVKDLRIHYLIELNNPANLALPYLIPASRRITFYNLKYFPYYNILIDEISALYSFFRIEGADPKKQFKFSKIELKNLSKTLSREAPILFVNGKVQQLTWPGGKFIFDRDKQKLTEAMKTLYLCDAYCGDDDEFASFARIFGKQIIQV